jgi:hypothetical protein
MLTRRTKSIKRTSFKSNLSGDVSKAGDNNNNNNNNNETSNDVKGLEVIKEGKSEEVKEKVENEENSLNQKQKLLKDKTDRINKNIDEIKIPISIDDITVVEPIQKKIFKELDNLILRNLSLISHLYMYSCGKEDIKASDIGLSTASPSMMSDTKSFFKQQLQGMKKEPSSNIKDKDKNMIIDDNIALQNDEKKEKVIDYDNIYNNDIYFCLDFKSYWKLIRDSGLITPGFSLAQVDRVIFRNPDNEIEMFFIPEELEKLNKKRDTDIIYNYLYQKILNSKKLFDLKYKALIDQSSILATGSIQPNQPLPDYLPTNENDKNKNKNESDYYLNYHDEKNIILLRYFYEILIRLAYLRFNDEENLPLEGRVKKLFDLLKSFFRMKRKTGMDSSITAISMVDPKLRNFDIVLELFIDNHYQLLKSIFVDLYKYTCGREKSYKEYDMTITYRFFYDNIILNSEKLSELFEDKMLYVDLISLYYKERKVCSNNIDYITLDDNEIFEYLDSLYEYEMIFREFCELVFNISRKYFSYYEIDTEYEDNKGIVLTKEEEKKREEERKKDKKKKKKHKNEKIDIYMIVIEEIIKAKDKIIEKKKKKTTGVDKYYFPYLKTHKTIERLREEEKQRIIKEEKRKKEIQRYENERKIFKEEDINIYKGERVEENNTETESLTDF